MPFAIPKCMKQVLMDVRKIMPVGKATQARDRPFIKYA
jgi:hypothetical protein